jgi:hypothetical protein
LVVLASTTTVIGVVSSPHVQPSFALSLPMLIPLPIENDFAEPSVMQPPFSWAPLPFTMYE